MEELCSFVIIHTLLRVVNKTPERIHEKLVFTTPCPPPLQQSLPNANSPPEAGKFGNRTPDAAFIPEIVSRVLSVRESHVVPQHPLVSGKLKSLGV